MEHDSGVARHRRIVQIDDYESVVEAEVIERIKEKARPLQGLHVAHVNSTYYGGGVAAILSPLTLLMNSLEIATEWRVIQGAPDFFSVTKKMHNALQSGEVEFSQEELEIYEQVVYENSIRNHLDHDRVIVHDPQPLPMIEHYQKKGPWIWRCHVDLSSPNRTLWNYLAQFIEKYDAVIVSLEEYAQQLETPQTFFMPAIDPFSLTNAYMSEDEALGRLETCGIPTDLPLVTQISRFDRWKDPQGVIEAFKIARKEVPARLVLFGNIATDDPEGEEIYQSLLDSRDDDIIIMSREDTTLVNALQRTSAVVLQKSIREGFGLTATEAMWKRTPVIAGNVGGLRYQVEDGVNGFLVSSVEEAAERIVQLLKDPELCEHLGGNGRKTVQEHFLMIHLLEQYLDLLGSFQPCYQLPDNHNEVHPSRVPPHMIPASSPKPEELI